MSNGILNSKGDVIATKQYSDPSLGLTDAHKQIIIIADANGTTLSTVGANGLKVELGSSLDKNIDSILTYPRGADTGTPLTASGLVLTGAGKLLSLFFSSVGNTPTCTVYNSTSASGNVLVPTFTPVAGTPYTFNYRVNTGIYIVLTVASGSISCVPGFDPTAA